MRDLIVAYLEGLPLLDNRFTNLSCVNYVRGSQQKRGAFSLIFKAIDRSDGKSVAIKFYDPTVMQVYRLQAFEREPTILAALVGKKRCAQLVLSLASHRWEFDGGGDFELQYFVLGWLDGDVEGFFYQQDLYEPATKLVLFHDLVSAVEAIQRNGVSHRDLKPDNFRVDDDGLPVVVDFGTAIQYDTAPLVPEYGTPVGALPYASPESYCGFAGDRAVAPYSDLYALGCMLYELFNPDQFLARLMNTTQLSIVLAAMSADMRSNAPADRRTAWATNVRQLKHMVPTPEIDGSGSTVPFEIVQNLNNLFKRLVCFDFNERETDFNWIRQRVMRTINILENDRARAVYRERKRRNRSARLERFNNRLLRSQVDTRRMP